MSGAIVLNTGYYYSYMYDTNRVPVVRLFNINVRKISLLCK